MKSKKQETPVKNRRLDGYVYLVNIIDVHRVMCILFCIFYDYQLETMPLALLFVMTKTRIIIKNILAYKGRALIMCPDGNIIPIPVFNLLLIRVGAIASFYLDVYLIMM